ncbi:MAG: B12-binding domain-containing radical SAM protein [Desulfobacteraceae bacterium]|nr:B12-binding domain-containing radical SAM protein [Desulfobacteraceae bacterium]
MVDVLLIQPPIRDFYLTAKRTIPYGLACIASCLRKEGFSVEILDALATGKSKKIPIPEEMSFLDELYRGPDISPFSLFHDYRHYGRDFEWLGREARNSGARIVGISSLFTAYSGEALKTAEAVKRWHPGAIVVLGGHHPTEMAAEVLRHDCVDYIMRGDGEEAFTRLVRALFEGKSPETVPGVGFKTAAGSIFCNPPAILEDPDGVPLPAIELTDLRFYRRKRAPCAVIVAGRGCPLSCSYCSIGSSRWNRFRLRSVPAVIAEMERAVAGHGVRFIDFEDENVSFRKEWFNGLLREICSRFGEYDLELRAMNGLFAPSLDGATIQAMKKAGFSALNLSLCTTCLAQLKRFRRPDVREAFENALFHARAQDMEAVGYIIVGAPGQRAEDSVEDLLYLATRKVLAGVSVFYPAPGSTEFERCREEGALPRELSLMRSTALPGAGEDGRRDSATLLRFGRILNFAKTLSDSEKADVLGRVGQPGTIAPAAGSGKGSEGCPAHLDESGRRREIGKSLLALFLTDGAVRGASREGEMFVHKTSRHLCLRFRDGLLDLLFRNRLR